VKLLVIDLGSFSVKFAEYKTDKKSLQVTSCSEIIIGQMKDQFHPDTPILDIQLEIVEGYLNHKHYDGKIIYQLPQTFLTTRFVEVPVTNKKKAELMIPFQLEENIPFQLNKSHVISEIFKNNGKMDAVVHITNLEEFEAFYNELGEREILPALLSPESSFIQAHIIQSAIKNDICVLDIGHSSTKAYFFHNAKLTSRHVAHVAGKSITEIISETYQIPKNEATIYKHENSFFLTENQYNEVDEAQKEFANIMKQAIWPLVQDFKRWDLGHRVNHGKSIDKIYLMGGSSQIKNITNFLSQALEIEIEMFPLNHLLLIKEDQYKMVETNPRFLLTNIMAAGQLAKHPPANFLTAQYSSGFTENIPLHSTGFIAARVVFFSLIIVIGLIIENTIIKNKNKNISKTIETIVKRSSKLNFTKKQIRELKLARNLPKTLKLIDRKNKNILQQVQVIKVAAQTDALLALTNLSRVVPKNKLIDMIKFENSDGEVHATFAAEELSKLEDLKETFNNSPLQNKEVSLSDKQKILEITFKGN